MRRARSRLTVGLVLALMSAGPAATHADRPGGRSLRSLLVPESYGRAWLGADIVDGRRGARVTGILADSPASAARLAAGDEIVAVDDRSIATADQLRACLARRAAGQTVRLLVERGASRFMVRAVLEPPPDDAQLLERRLLDRPAPPFALTVVRGRGPGDLPRLRGKVVLLEFMATWCGPCRTSYRLLADLERRRARDGLQVIAVSDENPAALRALAAREHLPFTLARDVGARAGRAYGATATPTLIVIDRQGVVRSVGMGAGAPVQDAVQAAEAALRAELRRARSPRAAARRAPAR